MMMAKSDDTFINFCTRRYLRCLLRGHEGDDRLSLSLSLSRGVERERTRALRTTAGKPAQLDNELAERGLSRDRGGELSDRVRSNQRVVTTRTRIGRWDLVTSEN